MRPERLPGIAQPVHDRGLQQGRNPGNVWTLPTAAGRTGHPAPWPLEIPRRCIAAGSPPGGHVLDPFSGSGTTGVVARELGRRYTGIDINPAFTALAERRLSHPPSGPPIWGLPANNAGATLQGPNNALRGLTPRGRSS